MSPELINRKIGIFFPRHQQHQQLGGKRPQRLLVDQLDLFARLQISNLKKGECKPSSDHLILTNKTNRGSYTKQSEWVSLWQQPTLRMTLEQKLLSPSYSSTHKPKLHPFIFHVVFGRHCCGPLLLCSFFLAVFPKDRQVNLLEFCLYSSYTCAVQDLVSYIISVG